jgi:hypothetical protein
MPQSRAHWGIHQLAVARFAIGIVRPAVASVLARTCPSHPAFSGWGTGRVVSNFRIFRPAARTAPKNRFENNSSSLDE